MKLIRVMFALCVVLAVAGSATAQGQQDGQAQQRMMMGGSQMPMAGMMSQGGMMPMMGMTDHIEGRLAFLKTELKIRDAQLPQWNAFADAMRACATQMKDMMKQGSAIKQDATPPSLPQRLDLSEKRMTTHLEMLRKMKAALLPLYASLSEPQRRSADELLHSPMGM